MKYRYISRIDSEKKRTHGWFVRINQNSEKSFSKFFADTKHGSKEEALRKAMRYRDRILKITKSAPSFKRQRSSNNTTGVPGVSEYRTQNKKTGKEERGFRVVWCPEPNKPKFKYFFITKNRSRAEALNMAADYRKEKEIEMHAAFEKELKKNRRSVIKNTVK